MNYYNVAVHSWRTAAANGRDFWSPQVTREAESKGTGVAGISSARHFDIIISWPEQIHSTIFMSFSLNNTKDYLNVRFLSMNSLTLKSLLITVAMTIII